MTDPAKPLLTREMFASDEEFWNSLIRMARTGPVGPLEPAPLRPPLGPISRKALAHLGLAPTELGGAGPYALSAPTTPTPSSSTRGPEEDGAASGVEQEHVPKNAKGRAANAAPANSWSTTIAVLPHRTGS
jgi:hypothetical protein